MKPIHLNLFVIVLLLSLAACSAGALEQPPSPPPAAAKPAGKTPLVVFAAGSLIRPLDDLEKAFEAQNPHIEVQSEYHGSIQVIRHATELHEPIDVVATADHALIPMLMYTTQNPATGKSNASWYLRFATNRLGLAYTTKSKYAGEINSDNWHEILTRPDVRVGIADPRFDAAGYRAMMVFQLAQEVYGQMDLFNRMFAGAFKYPVLVSEEGGTATVRIPEILESRKGSHVVLRGASIQLIALLESGDLDYAFEYESVIRQHGLKVVELPNALNLGTPGMDEVYGRVNVRLDFQRFASVKPEFKGEQIGYGITIPDGAPQPQAAAQYIAFLLGPGGRQIVENDYQPMLTPAESYGYANIPELLKPLSNAAP